MRFELYRAEPTPMRPRILCTAFGKAMAFHSKEATSPLHLTTGTQEGLY